MSIKDRIIDNINWVKQNMGYTLVKEGWGNDNMKCTCALGCVLLQDDPKDVVRIEDDSENSSAAAHILEVSSDWVDAFIDGFDGNGFAEGSKHPEAFNIGKEVSLATNPVVFSDYEQEKEEELAEQEEMEGQDD